MNNRKNSIMINGFILLVLNVIASVLNYLCQILMARGLDVVAFGTINTIFSFLLIIGVPGTTLTMVSSKYIAGDIECKNGENSLNFCNNMTWLITLASIAVFFLCVLIKNPLRSFLKIDNYILMFLSFIVISLSFYYPFYSGIFSGLKKFYFLGTYSLLIPIYKLIGIFLSGNFTNSMTMRLVIILLSIAVGSVISSVIGSYYSKIILGRYKQNINCKNGWIEEIDFINPLIINACLTFYLNIDLLAVRYLGGSELSGYYSSIVLFGRIIYYLATTFGTILLPYAASKGNASIGLLNKTIIIILLVSIVGFIPINIFGEHLILLLYGMEYTPAIDYLKYISIISTAVGILTVLINFMIGIGDFGLVKKVLIMLVIVITSSILLGVQVKMILSIIGMSGLICCFLIYINLIFKIAKKNA